MADNVPSRRKPLDLLFCFPSIRPSVILLAFFLFSPNREKDPISEEQIVSPAGGERGAARNRLVFGGTAAGFAATILSGGGWPANSQRKTQTNFVLVEAVSTYIRSLMFAGPAGGAGHTLREAESPSATLLGMGVQGRAAAGLRVADNIPQSHRRGRTGQTATPPFLARLGPCPGLVSGGKSPRASAGPRHSRLSVWLALSALLPLIPHQPPRVSWRLS